MIRIIGIVLLVLALLLALVALFVRGPESGESVGYGIGYQIGKWMPSTLAALLGTFFIYLGRRRSLEAEAEA